MPRSAGREPTVELRRRRRGDGTWSETPTVRYYDELGIRRRRSFATMAEAEFERARLALDQSRHGPIAGPTESMTLADFWPTYHADACSRLQEATIASYEGIWRRAVEKRLGDRPLDQITPREISMWRAEMQRAGKGPEAIRMSMMLVQAMFTLALEWGEASSNPVALVRKPRQGRQRAIDVMDPKLVERVRRWMLDHVELFSATLVSVLAYSGMRPGEALALERRHIRNDTILVEQAVALGRIKLQKTGRIYRTVDLLPPLRDDLTTWFAARGHDDPDARLFARDDGEWFKTDDWNNWRNRHFYAAFDALDITRRRPYDLRHSFVSLMIREGELSIVELADQLGHAATETLKTYAHVFAEYRRQRRVPATQLIADARRAVEP
ncbi:MAG TPA: tyrosine-type recombinase/integrase [Baekduia sp.]|nr:tyrosine-type recombinase/integrase [Baekduia sp.]